MTITVTTEETRKGFYPTPPELAAKLLADISWAEVKTILEPSCGTGNLLWAIGREIMDYRNTPNLDVDLVEIDPALRGIVTKQILNASHSLYYDQYRKLLYDNDGKYVESSAERDELRVKYITVDHLHARFVHEDFLAMETDKKYDLIVMNPPFADGDAHLLKALAMQRRYGGEIRCLLNAETLRNPYTSRRKALASQLEELNADIEYVDNAFAEAERPTDVSVALIKVSIPSPHRESYFYERLRRAEAVKLEEKDPTELTVADKVEAIVSQYRVEVKAGIAIIQEYIGMKPYILESVGGGPYNYPILGIAVASDHVYRNSDPDVNAYIKAVRKKYWTALFKRKDIFGQLTSNLQDSLSGRIQEMVDYEFDAYNIRQLILEMNSRMEEGIKETILNLFQEFTCRYHWRDDPDVENIHYYNGWASNKAHKVNKKIILPAHGFFATNSWEKKTFSVSTAYAKLSDIEKALCYLDGERTACVDLYSTLNWAASCGKTRKIPCRFFEVTFFKKGTMHITFTNQELLDRLNIYCGREKNWLPPSYGRKKYEQMDQAEQAVIDSFHGDDTPGSGKEGYAEVIAHSDYYLVNPTSQQVNLIGICG